MMAPATAAATTTTTTTTTTTSAATTTIAAAAAAAGRPPSSEIGAAGIDTADMCQDTDNCIEIEQQSGLDSDDHEDGLVHRAVATSMQAKKKAIDVNVKQKKFAQQRSILKNSMDCTADEHEILEAKKQLILRRRRLFSHYRQYEQWRRRQFSYDPSYFRPNPLPQTAAIDYTGYSSSGGGGGGGIGIGIGIGVGSSAVFNGGGGGGGGVAAHRRRRQYRRQYSCADRSREGSRESRESSSMHKYHSMVASDTINTDSSFINYTTTNNHSEPVSHIHMLQEEHSTSISERCTRSRINSAIFVSSEGRGFDSIEFLRRHGSQSVLCRKAKSAENITDNGRKKSFAEKRQWRTDEDETGNMADDGIELKERGRASDLFTTLSVIKANNQQRKSSTPTVVTSMLARSAAFATSNIIVGSISLEAPPAYIKNDSEDAQIKDIANAVSQDSTDTVEELIQIPASVETRPRVLVHQRSSTASSSPHGSPKHLPGLRINIKPKIGAVPMVSVSGPSPPVEKPPLSECL